MGTQNPTATKYVFCISCGLFNVVLWMNEMKSSTNYNLIEVWIRFTDWRLLYLTVNHYEKGYFLLRLLYTLEFEIKKFIILFFRQARHPKPNNNIMNQWLPWFALVSKGRIRGYFTTNISIPLMENGRLIWITKLHADKIKLKSSSTARRYYYENNVIKGPCEK